MRLRSVLEESRFDLHTPMLCDIEVAAALRRAAFRGVLDARRLSEALIDYADLALERHPHLLLLPRLIELRDNFSAYDATYVALAERLEAQLLSADEGMVAATKRHTAVRTIPW